MKWKASVTQLMALIAVLAVGLAAMKSAAEGAARLMLLGSLIALLLGTVGAFVRQRRAAWVGFSVFGWGYFAIFVVPTMGPSSFSSLDSTTWHRIRIDALVAPAVNWLHPEVPAAIPPFPYNSDDSTGKLILYRVSPTGNIPLTPDEFKEVVAYTSQFAAREFWLRTTELAFWIGMAFQGLAFAFIGAGAGHLLDDRSSPAIVSSEAPTSNPAD